ncbi:MAG TPA: 16S rRNA (cytosine(1402)-N(4))-methyltransferase RsmH [Blastocatellia bacterium]|nr:16S rRNA (cytosine(1402)-N(4))-methyltransferase RsmH [Blastocatellia bacterium]
MSESGSCVIHQPVLLKETLDALKPQRGGWFIDCTLGLGGHSEAMLTANPDVRVIGIDADAESIQLATRRLEPFGDRFRAVHANFKELDTVLAELKVERVNGILADLGISSYQLDTPGRGFSFQDDAPLDMRINRSSGQTAASLVNSLGESELADIIYQYGEERGARKIARMIVRERAKQAIETTQQLANLAVRALRVKGRWRIHPATRTFQALRIAVNQELDGLGEFISKAITYLEPAARLAVISFHSLEDRIVKSTFRLESGVCQCPHTRGDEPWRMAGIMPETEAAGTGSNSGDIVCYRCGAKKRVVLVTRKPIRPSEEEVSANPRSRSARLRVCERIA